ncbi:MAG: hypothetical protein E5V48_02615 [Mesorhizobium sp.]|nr:MAG: hypothetical protein E5V48_02615 [Mesorhizobium sp.]
MADETLQPDPIDPPSNPAPHIEDEPTAVETESPLFSRFRKLWNGGERRAALEWAKTVSVTEGEWAGLMAEFPELIDIINGN